MFNFEKGSTGTHCTHVWVHTSKWLQVREPNKLCVFFGNSTHCSQVWARASESSQGNARNTRFNCLLKCAHLMQLWVSAFEGSARVQSAFGAWTVGSLLVERGSRTSGKRGTLWETSTCRKPTCLVSMCTTYQLLQEASYTRPG